MSNPTHSLATPDAARPTRREVLSRGAAGFGGLALTALLADEGRLVAGPDATPVRRSSGRVRSVVLLFMGGGPSQIDTFDPKPDLARLHGQDVPPSLAAAVPPLARASLRNIIASPWKFAKHGQCGTEVSELLPETAKCVDDICVLRGCRHDVPIHAPAEYLTLTGTSIGDRPSLGSWLTYGLGSETRDLPAFVVLPSRGSTRPPGWAAGFLPARYQGTLIDPAEGVPHARMPAGMTARRRQAQLALLGELNRQHAAAHPGDSELEARVRSYELAYRAQSAAPEAFDVTREPEEVRRLYGLGQTETAEFGRQCLVARRLVERGVRFVTVYLSGAAWDAHADLKGNHTQHSRATDRPTAALLTDLKRSGLLDSTLVVWGGEFGRTPTAEGRADKPGRDHNPSGYTMWLAGGGVKGGQIIGATDPIGYTVVERPVHPNDLHATVLHALGIDQHDLYFERNGRRELVTVNGGRVIDEVFA